MLYDFGRSRPIDEKELAYVGNLYFQAPELTNSHGASDVFSFGGLCLFVSLLASDCRSITELPVLVLRS